MGRLLMKKIRCRLEFFLEPFVLLGIRLYMWNVFYASGRQKLDNYLNGDWESTIFLFREVHPVPFLPAEVAAVLATAGEIGLSSLLVIGLFGRFAALGLLVVTAVIELQFQYNDMDYMTLPEHMMWGLLLATILVRGSGALSLDRLFYASRKL